MGRTVIPVLWRTVSAALLALLLAAPSFSFATVPAEGIEEQGRYITYLLLYEVGSETYALRATTTGSLLTITSTLQDRRTVRASTTSLETGPDLSPVLLETKRDKSAAGYAWLTRVGATGAAITEGSTSRTAPRPSLAFIGFQQMPAAVQMMMMRYWSLHHQPLALPMLRADPTAPPIEIRRVGTDTLSPIWLAPRRSTGARYPSGEGRGGVRYPL